MMMSQISSRTDVFRLQRESLNSKGVKLFEKKVELVELVDKRFFMRLCRRQKGYICGVQ